MMDNNPATCAVDMSPELLLRMFEAVDNVAMVKESTGDLSANAAHPLDQRRPAALRQRERSLVPASAAPRRVRTHHPALIPTMQCARANYQERKPITRSANPCGEFALAATGGLHLRRSWASAPAAAAA
jgi:hypothetical protein